LAVRIRLSRRGAKKAPFYRIIVIDSRVARDGKYLAKLGTYNPLTDPPDIVIDRDATVEWLKKGAIPSQTVSSILEKQDISI
jgi:small subunit ribosomal protein S16